MLFSFILDEEHVWCLIMQKFPPQCKVIVCGCRGVFIWLLGCCRWLMGVVMWLINGAIQNKPNLSLDI